MILPSNKNGDNAPTQEQCASASTTENITNILLLGESGVGKSTFINAFVNYLLFETLEKAESNKPVVLIPVSFQMTTGDNFEERVINFGGFDNFNNENFDHPGQSVTQQCKSYLFTLKHTNGRKLRIIDTPGFGDTRGIDQDDMNMQHILKYANNMTHLNAICFLLKANATQLNNYFPICLTQLLDLLGPDARQNIIFCFTNARPSFYSPGDTARLLKTMLKSPLMVDIPFKKENTFCFDNESFRYLVALKNGIDFPDDGQKHEYEMSWSTSFKESNRLVSYVNDQLKAYSLSHNQQSNKHAQIKIMQMIRPMLEAMRNIFRHIILDDLRLSNKSIKLRPATIYRPASKCNACERIPLKFGNFLIASDDPHEIHNHCYLCSCSPSQHSSIDYVLQYELLGISANYDRNRMDDIIRQLCLASNKFAYFLIHIIRSTKHDPFAIGLENILNEEEDLCQVQRSNNLNPKLVENLKKLQRTYDQTANEMNSKKKPIELSTIYEWIGKVCALPEVREQMVAVKQSQETLMAEYEYVVSKDLIK
jgi:GTP-binding protein EngB required for normal cell division/cytidylate kinase